MGIERKKPRPTFEALEIELFLSALKRRHGYDFTEYAGASMKRRVTELAVAANCSTIAELIPRVIHDDGFLPFVISHLSVPVTEMFRDPAVYQALRRHVMPKLRTYPRINAWIAGCATGQEVYSLAILLHEEGLYDRAQIYATDINDHALSKAEEGVFPTKNLELYARNYTQAGGTAALSDYFLTRYDFSMIDAELKKNILFAHHNLVSDGVFCDMHLILCRNVLIYFERPLQDHVLRLFRDSLVRGGYLCIGTKESLRFSDVGEEFDLETPAENVFRKRLVLD